MFGLPWMDSRVSAPLGQTSVQAVQSSRQYPSVKSRTGVRRLATPLVPRSGPMICGGHARMQFPQRMQTPSSFASSTAPGGRSGRGRAERARRSVQALAAPIQACRTLRRDRVTRHVPAALVSPGLLRRTRSDRWARASCSAPRGQNRAHHVPGQTKLNASTAKARTALDQAPDAVGVRAKRNSPVNRANGSSQSSTGQPSTAPPTVSQRIHDPSEMVLRGRRPSRRPSPAAPSAQVPMRQIQRQNHRRRSRAMTPTPKPRHASMLSVCVASIELIATKGLRAGTTACHHVPCPRQSRAIAIASAAARTHHRMRERSLLGVVRPCSLTRGRLPVV